jgi:hypothetical protein
VDCRVFLTFFQILLGVVLPTLALARMNRPLGTAAEAPPDAPPAAQTTATSRPPAQLSRLRTAAAAATAAGAKAAAEAEAAVQHLCGMLAGRAGSLLLAAAAWWALLGWCWVLATALEQPGVSAWLGAPTTL